MRSRLMTLIVVGVFALAIAPKLSGARVQDNRFGDELRERDEMNQTYEFAPGATIEVSGINGPVEIDTASSTTAVVHIIRSANTQEDLAHHRILVDHSSSSLVVHGEEDHSRAKVRQHVMLTVPRAASLKVSGVNGRVKAGEFDGPATISGINGRVEVGQAIGYSTITGINGAINITLARLGERGLHMSGINGSIDLKFADELNADLEVSSINGQVYTELPNVTMQGKWSPTNFHARIGSGGAPITISGVNGRIKLGK
jgi:hypothetical protein